MSPVHQTFAIQIPKQLKKQRGMTLLEILVAVLVLSIGMLGVAGLQTSNMRNAQSAHQRTMAVMLASGMAERIRANRALALTGAFKLSKTCTPITTAGSIQQLEHKNWISEIQTGINSASTTCGEVSYDSGTRTYTITVHWDDSRALGGDANMKVWNLVTL